MDRRDRDRLFHGPMDVGEHRGGRGYGGGRRALQRAGSDPKGPGDRQGMESSQRLASSSKVSWFFSLKARIFSPICMVFTFIKFFVSFV